MPGDCYDLAIRLDSSESADLVRFLSADGGAYIVVAEKLEENPHFHVYLRTTRKPNAVRVALKRAIPGLNGNGSYSVSVVRDVQRYYQYIMKGESREEVPVVEAAHGMEHCSEDWRKVMHDAYWDENEETARRRKLLPVAEAVLAQCKEAKIRWDDIEGIGKIYIRELVRRDKAINIFSVKSNCYLIQVKLCPDESAIELLAGKLI